MKGESARHEQLCKQKTTEKEQYLSNDTSTAIRVLYNVPTPAAVLYESFFVRMHRNISDDFYMAIRPLL